MAKTIEVDAGRAPSIRLPVDCSIRTIKAICGETATAISSGQGIALDCSAIEQADITFVQFVVSTERSLTARGLPLTIEAAPAAVLSAFARAGVPLPGAA